MEKPKTNISGPSGVIAYAREGVDPEFRSLLLFMRVYFFTRPNWDVQSILSRWNRATEIAVISAVRIICAIKIQIVNSGRVFF